MSNRDHIHLPTNLGNRMADRITSFSGSWPFIFGYLGLTVVWCVGNIILWSFDKYPYQFYTFSVSVLAILMSSVILLSQNRSAEKDAARDNHEAEEVDRMFGLQQDQMMILRQQNQVMEQQHVIMLAALDEVKEHLTKLEPGPRKLVR